jgi:hypothetical protein
MIVPISLTFSRDMRTLRNEILRSTRIWCISSYDRIPDAIFGHNVRTRNSIAIMSPSTNGKTKVLSSPMMRWFKAERPQLFQKLHFHRCTDLHNACGFPKLGSDLQASALEKMLQNSQKLGSILLRQGNIKNVVYYKDNAYNWLTITRSLPPAFDSNGKPVPQTKYGTCYSASSDTSYIIVAVCSGLLLYWFWLIYGDGFDVTRTLLEEFPLNPSAFSKKTQQRLVKMGREIQSEMERYIVYKLNAGKRIGNYNLRQCRLLTDQVDELIVDELNLGRDFLADVRTFCAATVRTQINAPEEN